MASTMVSCSLQEMIRYASDWFESLSPEDARALFEALCAVEGFSRLLRAHAGVLEDRLRKMEQDKALATKELAASLEKLAQDARARDIIQAQLATKDQELAAMKASQEKLEKDAEERGCAGAKDAAQAMLAVKDQELAAMKASQEKLEKDAEERGRAGANDATQAMLAAKDQELAAMKASRETEATRAAEQLFKSGMKLRGPLPQKEVSARSSSDGSAGESQCLHLLTELSERVMEEKAAIVAHMGGDYDLEASVLLLGGPGRGHAHQGDGGYLLVRVKDAREGADVATVELRVESKEGSNNHKSYAKQVWEDLQAQRHKHLDDPTHHVHSLLVVWHDTVSQPDRLKLAAQKVPAYERASDTWNYIAMLYELFCFLREWLVEAVGTAHKAAADKAMAAVRAFEEDFMAKARKDFCVMAARMAGDPRERGVPGTQELEHMWTDVLGVIPQGYLLEAIRALIGKTTRKGRKWSPAFVEDLRSLLPEPKAAKRATPKAQQKRRLDDS